MLQQNTNGSGMKRVIRQILCIAILLSVISCARDLPQRDPESEINRAIIQAQGAEVRARGSLEAAKLERQKAEALLEEVRIITKQNKRACEIQCQKEKRKHAAFAAKIKASEPEQAQKLSEPKDPEYSPSDAPDGWKQK